MNITVQINNEKLRYDAYQIIKIFHPYDEVVFISENAKYIINISEKEINIGCDGQDKTYVMQGEKSVKEQLKTAVYVYFSEKLGVSHPWGTLVGIRPTKIAASLMEQGWQTDNIVHYYKEHYSASPQKAKLCIEVAENETEYLKADKKKVSIYIGMPFCPTRCAYCSFTSNSIVGNGKLVQPYLEALKYEIESLASYIREGDIIVESVYFGGGTPTSVNSSEFEFIMSSIYGCFVKDYPLKEFTVEAGRPDSISEEKLKIMKDFEVTRISINPQSMNDSTLKSIGRFHTVEDVRNKYHMARKMGFNNINMDIIVGLPGEGIKEIENSCFELLKLEPDSITVHGMSIKRGSKLHEQLLNNKYSSGLGIEELKQMFDMTRVTAERLNMIPYYLYRQKNMIGNMENIGYARKGMECIYNIKIMEENQTIIALGADAVTKVVFSDENRIERYANLKEVSEYVKRVNEMIEGKIELLDTLYKSAT